MRGDNGRFDRDWQQKVFVADLEQVQPGDILLTRSPGERTSDAIAFATSSDVSHAILILEPPYAIESADFGVVKFRIDRFAASSPHHIRVLRLKGGLTAAHQAALIRAVEPHIGKEYNTIGALMSVVPLWRGCSDHRLFCSQLVASAYAQINISLSKSASKCTPADLGRLDSLYIVTDAVRQTTPEALGFMPARLDGPNDPSPQEGLTAAMQMVTDQTGRLLVAAGATKPATFFELLTSLVRLAERQAPAIDEIDAAVADAIVQSGMVEIARKLARPDAPDFFRDLDIHHAILAGVLGYPGTREEIEQFIARTEVFISYSQITLEERRRDIQIFSDAYGVVGLGSLKLCLAGMHEAYIFQRRYTVSQERCVRLLKSYLKNCDTGAESGADPSEPQPSS